MKTVIAALAAVTAVAAVAGPAAAQPGRYEPVRYEHRWDGAHAINARQAEAWRRIQLGLRTGALTPREADRLRAELRQIEHREAGFRQRGLTPRERADLDRRMDNLEWNIARQAHDRDYGYGYGYGYGYRR